MQNSLLKEKSSCRNVSEVLGFQTGKALFVLWLAHFPVCLSFSFCHVWSYLFRFYQENAWRFIARHDSKYTKRKLLKTREHWYNIFEICGKQNLKCFVNTLSSVVRIRPGYRIGNKTADLMLMLLTSKTFFKTHVLPERAQKQILDDTYIIYLNYMLWFTVKYRGIPNEITNICRFWSQRHVKMALFPSIHYVFLFWHRVTKTLQVTIAWQTILVDKRTLISRAQLTEHNYFVLANKGLTLDGLTSLMDCCFKTRGMKVVDYLGVIRQMSIGRCCTLPTFTSHVKMASAKDSEYTSN